MKLQNRIAIVTGAGSGMGASCARAFAAAGAHVCCVDVNDASARQTARAIEEAGGQALAVRADVTSAADTQAVIDRTLARWNRIDVFFANAGVPQSPVPVEDVDEATFERILAVNVKGVFLGIKHVAPVMKRQRSGVILATASTMGVRPRPGFQAYVASKAAVIGLIKAVALELAPHGIRAVTIAPGATDTPMLASFLPAGQTGDAGRQAFLSWIPMGRLSTPTDVAAVAVFLASDDAAMLTGSVFPVDGGRAI